jgi:hypothetical protein
LPEDLGLRLEWKICMLELDEELADLHAAIAEFKRKVASLDVRRFRVNGDVKTAAEELVKRITSLDRT